MNPPGMTPLAPSECEFDMGLFDTYLTDSHLVIAIVTTGSSTPTSYPWNPRSKICLSTTLPTLSLGNSTWAARSSATHKFIRSAVRSLAGVLGSPRRSNFAVSGTMFAGDCCVLRLKIGKTRCMCLSLTRVVCETDTTSQYSRRDSKL